MNWTDTTSYSQGQRGKAAQTAWSGKVGGVTLWISCGHIDYPGEWVFTCRGLGIYTASLGSVEGASSEQARNRAVSAAWSKAGEIESKMGDLGDALFAVPPLA